MVVLKFDDQRTNGPREQARGASFPVGRNEAGATRACPIPRDDPVEGMSADRAMGRVHPSHGDLARDA